MVGDNYSPEFCKDIKNLLSEKYDVEATVGKKINKDGLNILVHLFGRIGNAVHDTFHITLYGRYGSFKVMRDVGDKFPVIVFVFDLFTGAFF